MTDFEEILIEYIQKHDTLDIAEYEFKKAISEDNKLKSEYKNWCEEMGYSERHGFREFAAEYAENFDSIWDSLKDYDE